MTRYRITIETYVNAASPEEAFDRGQARFGSGVSILSVTEDEPANDAAPVAHQERQLAATALDRWKFGNKMAPELTRASSFDVVDALLRYVVAASRVGRS